MATEQIFAGKSEMWLKHNQVNKYSNKYKYEDNNCVISIC